MLVFYPIACTVVNYSNTFELNVVKHHLFTSWVSNAADIPSISCSCQIILRVSDHGQTLRDWVLGIFHSGSNRLCWGGKPPAARICRNFNKTLTSLVRSFGLAFRDEPKVRDGWYFMDRSRFGRTASRRDFG
jgi:hypothetical protein